jgi:hypothetical protein
LNDFSKKYELAKNYPAIKIKWIANNQWCC